MDRTPRIVLQGSSIQSIDMRSPLPTKRRVGMRRRLSQLISPSKPTRDASNLTVDTNVSLSPHDRRRGSPSSEATSGSSMSVSPTSFSPQSRAFVDKLGKLRSWARRSKVDINADALEEKVARVPMTQNGKSTVEEEDALSHDSQILDALPPLPMITDRALEHHNIYEHLSLHTSHRSVSCHSFHTPPNRILDLGCGPGVWLFDAAQEFSLAECVGLDIQESYPQLDCLSCLLDQDDPLLRMYKRCSFVQTSSFNRMPFADNEFDYVHARGLAIRVPELQWKHIVNEVFRILKPGGVFEIIESDLCFPSPSSHPFIDSAYAHFMTHYHTSLYPASFLKPALESAFSSVTTTPILDDGVSLTAMPWSDLESATSSPMESISTAPSSFKPPRGSGAATSLPPTPALTPHPVMSMYRLYMLSVVLALGPSIRAHWVQSNPKRPKEDFDIAWEAFEIEATDRRRAANITQLVDSFATPPSSTLQSYPPSNTSHGPLPSFNPPTADPPKGANRKRKIKTPILLEPLRPRETTVFVAQKGSIPSHLVAPSAH